MKRSLVLLAALAGAVLVWLAIGRDPARTSTRAAPSPGAVPPREAPAVVESALEKGGSPASRSALPAGSASEPAPGAELVAAEPSSAPPSLHVRGRVLDRAGEGVPGVPLVQVGRDFILGRTATGTRVATSRPDGSFEADLPGFGFDAYIEPARDSGWATLRAAHVRTESAAGEQLVLVAPAIALAGTVIEAGGDPLEGAQVSYEVPLQALVGFPLPLDGTVEAELRVATLADGSFALPRVPATSGARLVVEHEGFRSLEHPAPGEAQDDLRLELERLGEEEPWLLGVVVRVDGSPARGAKVRLGTLADTADAEGRFGIEKGWADPEAPLVAALIGYQPAVLPKAGELLQQEFPPPLVRLVLGERTLTIEGKVLDAAGAPGEHWQISLFDGTVMTPNQIPCELAEDLAHGKTTATTTDKRGEFELEGLLPRDYVVQAFQHGSLLMLRSDPVPAGTSDLVLRIPADAFLERVEGQVVARDGTPLAGIQVGSSLTTIQNGGASQAMPGRSVLTDAAGRFSLENVPRRFVQLKVESESVIPQEFELDPARIGQELRLSVARRLHFRVALDPGGKSEDEQRPDGIVVLDAEGAYYLPMYLFQGNGWSSSTAYSLERLGTNTLGVSEDARTLVFYHGNTELRRVPLALAPDEVAVVRWED